MFKRLKEKITEDVMQSPIRLPTSVQRLGQYSPFKDNGAKKADDESSDPVSSTSGATQNLIDLQESGPAVLDPSSSSVQFSISEDDGALLSPTSSATPDFETVDLGEKDLRQETPSASSTISQQSFFPTYSPIQSKYNIQSDLESASEVEDSSVNLDAVSNEQLFSALQKTRVRYLRYKSRCGEAVRAYREQLGEKEKIKTILTESQDKALRRISELKEQSQLDRKAKAHLEESFNVMLEEKQELIDVLRTQVRLLKGEREEAEGAPDLAAVSANGEVSPQDKVDSADLHAQVRVYEETIAKLKNLLKNCKETITRNKEVASKLTAENKDLTLKLEEANELLHSAKTASYERERLPLKEIGSMAKTLKQEVMQQKGEFLELVQLNRAGMQAIVESFGSLFDRSELESCKLQLESAQSELRCCREELERHTSDLERERDKLRKLSQRNEELQQLEATVERLQKEQKEIASDREKVQMTSASVQQQFDALQASYDFTNTCLTDALSKNDLLNGRLQSSCDTNSQLTVRVTDLTSINDKILYEIGQTQPHVRCDSERSLSDIVHDLVLELEHKRSAETERDEALVQVKRMEKQLADLTSSVDDLEEKLTSGRAELDSAKAAHLEMQNQIDREASVKLADALSEKEQMVSQLREDIEALQTRSVDFEKREQSLSVSIEDVMRENEIKLEEVRQSFAKDLEDSKMEAHTARSELEILKCQLEQSKHTSVEMLTNFKIKTEQMLALLRQQLVLLKEQLVKEQQELADRTRELGVELLSNVAKRCEAERQQFEEESGAYADRICVLEKEREESASKICELSGEIKVLRDDRDGLKVRYASEEQRCAQLQIDLSEMTGWLNGSHMDVEQSELRRKELVDEVDKLKLEYSIKFDKINQELEQTLTELAAKSDSFRNVELMLQESQSALAQFQQVAHEGSVKGDQKTLELEHRIDVLQVERDRMFEQVAAEHQTQLEEIDRANSCKIEELKREIQVQLESLKEQHSGQTGKLENEIEELQSEKKILSSQQEALNNHVKQLTDDRESERNAFCHCKEQFTYDCARLEEIVGNIFTKADETLATLNGKLHICEAHVGHLRSTRDTREQFIRDVQHRSNEAAKKDEQLSLLTEEAVALRAKRDELEKMLRAGQDSQKDYEIQLHSLEALAERKALEIAASMEESHQEELSRFTVEIIALQGKRDELEETLHVSQGYRQELENQLQTAAAEAEQKALEIAAAVEERHQAALSRLMEEITVLRQKQDELEVTLHTSRGSQQDLEQQLQTLATEAEQKAWEMSAAVEQRHQAELSRLMEEIAVLREKRDELEVTLHVSQGSQHDLEQQLQTLTTEAEQKALEIAASVEERRQIFERQATLQAQVVQLEKQLLELQQSNQKLILEKDEAASQLSSRISQMEQLLLDVQTSCQAEKAELLAAWQSRLDDTEKEKARLASEVLLKNVQIDESLISAQANHVEMLHRLDSLREEHAQAEADWQMREAGLLQDIAAAASSSTLDEIPSGDNVEPLPTSLSNGEDEHASKIKRLANEFSLMMASREEEASRQLSKAIDDGVNEANLLQREHAAQLQEIGQQMAENEVQAEKTLAEKEDRIQELLSKLTDTVQAHESILSALRAEHCNRVDELDRKWKNLLSQELQRLQTLHDENVKELTSEWELERKELQQRAHLASTAAESGGQSGELLRRQIVAMKNQMEVEKERHESQVKELHYLLASNNQSSPRGPEIKGESVEIEYLKNILYEYMMGKETLTLAKVIAAVVRFSEEQTRRVLEREESRVVGGVGGQLHVRIEEMLHVLRFSAEHMPIEELESRGRLKNYLSF